VPPIPVPTVSLQSCVQVKNCIIRLVKGDLSNHAADVLVHSSGEYCYNAVNVVVYSSITIISTSVKKYSVFLKETFLMLSE